MCPRETASETTCVPVRPTAREPECACGFEELDRSLKRKWSFGLGVKVLGLGRLELLSSYEECDGRIDDKEHGGRKVSCIHVVLSFLATKSRYPALS